MPSFWDKEESEYYGVRVDRANAIPGRTILNAYPYLDAVDTPRRVTNWVYPKHDKDNDGELGNRTRLVKKSHGVNDLEYDPNKRRVSAYGDKHKHLKYKMEFPLGRRNYELYGNPASDYNGKTLIPENQMYDNVWDGFPLTDEEKIIVSGPDIDQVFQPETGHMEALYQLVLNDNFPEGIPSVTTNGPIEYNRSYGWHDEFEKNSADWRWLRKFVYEYRCSRAIIYRNNTINDELKAGSFGEREFVLRHVTNNFQETNDEESRQYEPFQYYDRNHLGNKLLDGIKEYPFDIEGYIDTENNISEDIDKIKMRNIIAGLRYQCHLEPYDRRKLQTIFGIDLTNATEQQIKATLAGQISNSKIDMELDVKIFRWVQIQHQFPNEIPESYEIGHNWDLVSSGYFGMCGWLYIYA